MVAKLWTQLILQCHCSAMAILNSVRFNGYSHMTDFLPGVMCLFATLIVNQCYLAKLSPKLRPYMAETLVTPTVASASSLMVHALRCRYLLVALSQPLQTTSDGQMTIVSQCVRGKAGDEAWRQESTTIT